MKRNKTETCSLKLVTAILFLSLMSPVPGYSQSTTEGPEKVAEIDAFIEQAFALDMSPGMAVSVVKNNEIIYAKGFGYADVANKRKVTPKTLFYIASTTKSFTAFAAALQHHHGKLDLDKPISHYLPELELQAPLSADNISLRDLLTHTHGISGGGPVDFRSAFTGEHNHDMLIRLLKHHGPSDAGRTFRYGNIGYNVAGLAMDKELGIGWKDLLEKEIFTSLGMTNTSGYLSKVDRDRLALPYSPLAEGFRELPYFKNDANMHSAGGHVSTVRDLGRWIIAHLNNGIVDGKQVFPAGVVAETHRHQADQDRQILSFKRHGWGLGWDIATHDGDTLYHRPGSFMGFFSYVSFRPQHKTGVAVVVNGSPLGVPLLDLAVTYIQDKLQDKPDTDSKYEQRLMQMGEQAAQLRQRIARDLERRGQRPQTLPYPLDAYAGTYENPEMGQMRWQIVDGKLEVKMGLIYSSSEVYDASQNQLRVELTGRGSVVPFTFEGNRARSLTFMGREYMRVVN